MWSIKSLPLIVAGLALAATAQDRVVGGIDADPDAWPYQAFILIDTVEAQHGCGGTLIAPQWVLTAAHCTHASKDRTKRFAIGDYSVRFGSHLKSSGGVLRKVKRVILHEQYSARYALENDIALLELDAPVELPAASLEAGAGADARSASPWAKVLGWGLTAGGNAASRSEVLQEAALPIVDNQRCDQSMRAKVPGAGAIDARRICAGQSEGGVDSCNGDSGGPLLAADNAGAWRQVGIVSYGVEECGAPRTYGVYTRVAAYAGWISKQISGAGSGSTATPAPLQLGLSAAAPALLAAAAENAGGLKLSVGPKALAIGDSFRISVTSPLAGYLMLFDIGPNNEVTQIFPNERATTVGKNGRIEAAQTLTIPDPSYGFEFTAAAPKGRGRLVAVVARDEAGVADILKPSDGLKVLANAPQTFARLEVVLKPQAADPKPIDESKLTDQAPREPAAWVAALTDYVVR